MREWTDVLHFASQNTRLQSNCSLSRRSAGDRTDSQERENKARQLLTRDRRLDVQTEVIKDDEGHIIGEIREENGSFLVWRRERPSFPPSSRHTFLGSAKSLEQARKLANELLR